MLTSLNRISIMDFITCYIKKTFLLVSLLFVIFTAPSLAFMQPDEQLLDDIATSHFDSFRVSDQAKLPASKKVIISEVTANFSGDWLLTFKGKTTKDYRNRVIQDYSQMLKKQLASKLLLAGWDVVDSYEEGAIEVKAQLKDLYINGPQKMAREHMLVRNIGQSSIVITVLDLDHQPIFIIEDKRDTGGLDSHFMETNSAVNYTWFNKLAGSWATVFVAYLDMSTEGIAGKS